MATIETIRAVCPHNCPDTCGMTVRLQDGRPVAVGGDPDHPFTDGFLCHKVSRYLERVEHPDRILHPMKRIGPKGGGGVGAFESISWEEAIQEIQNRIVSLDDPQQVLPYSFSGTLGKIQGESLDRRFFHRLGASQLLRTICSTAGLVGFSATVGNVVGTDPEAFAQSRYIINWGSNTAVTNMHLWVRMHRARQQGARIVTIDPYRCRTAERSDWHIRPRVGTDAALALGMMHVLFRDGLVDRDYMERHCVGTEALEERVSRDWSPQRASDVTGVPADDIEQLAREYGTTPPAAIRVNYGMQRHAGGGMAVRTISCLPAVIGAWRHRAGGVLLSTSGNYPFALDRLARPDLVPPGTRAINMNQLAEALSGQLDGPPVSLLFVYNANPAAIAPGQCGVIEGLGRSDLFTVVHEQFPTDTVDYADLVLPASTQLEHLDLHGSYGHLHVALNTPATTPPGECVSNTELFRRLAAAMGYESELFDVSDEDLVREALGEFAEQQPPALEGITLATLRQDGPQRLRLDSSRGPYQDGGFATDSGKCEFFSQALADQGIDPLPGYTPPAESVASAPELATRFPLQLVSPPSPHFLNSTFANVPSLKSAAGEPEIEIHSDDAASRGITDGAPVRIHNDRGWFRAKASVGDSVRDGVVVATGIWWNKHVEGGWNANATTPTRLADLGGGSTLFDNLVEVESLES